MLARLKDRSWLERYIVTEQSVPQDVEVVVEKHLCISYFSLVRIKKNDKGSLQKEASGSVCLVYGSLGIRLGPGRKIWKPAK